MTLVSRFIESAARKKEQPAIFCGEERISYQELEIRTRGLAQNLVSKFAVHRGDRIAILLKNSPDFIVALYAIYRAGATAVPLNTFLKAEEITFILRDCLVKTLITSDDFAETISKLRSAEMLPLNLVLRVNEPEWDRLHQTLDGVELPQPEPEDIAHIVYTSGTTGHPKGAMLTHANVTSNVQSCLICLNAINQDRFFLALPMFHSFMLCVAINLPLSIGAGIVIVRSLQPFKPVLREIVRRRVTIFLGIPQLFQAMAGAKVPFWFHWICPIRLAVSGSAPLPVETLNNFRRNFQFPLIEGYGLSEASPVVSFSPIHGIQKPGSIGLPIPNVEVKILDENDQEVPTGQTGELCVRGPNIMKGYYNQPEQTAIAKRNGWLHTGDIGRKDEDDYLYIVDRKKDMLLVHGNNVYPREIEEVLYKFPGVNEAAVVGRPDKHGELPIAFIVASNGIHLDEKEIRHFCKERLADYKLPREYRLLDKLPRNTTNKVDKKELRRLLQPNC